MRRLALGVPPGNVAGFMSWARGAFTQIEQASHIGAAVSESNSTAAGLAFLNAKTGEAVYDPASLNDGDAATTTVTVTGAVIGNMAMATFSTDLQGVMLTAWVSAADTVSVRFQNETTGVVDLGSGTIKAWVIA